MMLWLKNKIGKDKKVFVGMSGGVDSSVSAALLKKQGYDVTGAFMKVWHPDFLPCKWEDERRDAIRVCTKLGIPFVTFDLEKEYKQGVVDYMIDEYKAGRTPNPDVMCNKYVKFGAFLDKALEMGADFVATGHYAQNFYNNGKYELTESVDTNKDQTYFLWTLGQEQLKHILFPVGKYTKPKVRKLATKFGLSTAEKKDSQGLCFIGKVDMKDFLKHFIEEKKGEVTNEEGKVIGSHDGVLYYTIGQRHGFLIDTKETNSNPHFIIAKDLEKNQLIVSENPEGTTTNPKILELESESWVSGSMPENGSYLTRFRYRQKLLECKLESRDGKTFIEFSEPQTGVSSGQSLVLYKDKVCLGGGIIE